MSNFAFHKVRLIKGCMKMLLPLSDADDTYFIYVFSSLIIDLSSHAPMAANYFVQNICDSWCRLFNDSFFFRASRQTINAKNPVSTSINFLKITKDDSACYITSFATVILCKSGIFFLSIFFSLSFPVFDIVHKF